MKLELFHRRRAESDTSEDVLLQIKEGRSAAESCGYDLNALHCKGCIYACALAMARCDTGREAAAALEAMKKAKAL